MESPNSLRPPKAKPEKMKKWPLYIIALVVLGLFGVLFYSVNYNDSTKKDVEKQVVVVPQERPLTVLEGHGLSLQPPSDSPAVLRPEDQPQPQTKGPLVVVRNDPAQAEESARLEQEQRRAKQQAYVTALASPLVAKRIGTDNAANKTENPSGKTNHYSQTAAVQQPVDMSMMDPNQADSTTADRDKEQFFERSGREEWLSPYTRELGRSFEIKTGTVIPGIMVSGINSDLPGNLIAQVSQNVYDTATGYRLLIPQGSKLYGVYDSRVVYGQSRVLIAWNRLNFPDGSAVTLGAMPGADMSGYAGHEDQVDNHYLRIFGSSLLMSLITGSTSYAMDNVSNNSDNSDGTSVQDAMAAALAAQMGQTTLSLLQKNLNIKPTLEIRPGYQFNVIVTKDVVFKEPYTRRDPYTGQNND
ncbi:TrbI/VirB10 family protein [Desulfocastanea catecholica]